MLYWAGLYYRSPGAGPPLRSIGSVIVLYGNGMRDGRSIANGQRCGTTLLGRRLLQRRAHLFWRAGIIKQELAFNHADGYSLLWKHKLITSYFSDNTFPTLVYHAASDGTRCPTLGNPSSARMSGAFLNTSRSLIRTMCLVHFPAGQHIITDDTPHTVSTIASRRTLIFTDNYNLTMHLKFILLFTCPQVPVRHVATIRGITLDSGFHSAGSRLFRAGSIWISSGCGR